MQLFLFDSKKKEKLAFVPQDPSLVRIYVCGPTVYDDAHLGHARSSIAFDILRRLLKELGFKVLFVKNFTDIDDKIINKAAQSAKSVEEVSKQFTQNYLDEMQELGVARADIEPRVSESLDSIISMISRLLECGAAYQTPNGDVYLEVAKDEKYGTLSGRDSENESLARVVSSEQKRDVRDFALWKSYKGGADVGYPSPFGRGRPGWHIECSAMIEEYLADKNGEFLIDIHGGGADLLFPHHENECSQSRCASGKELAKYWIHNGFVTINNEKMSKSLGNSFFMKDALKAHSGEALRFYLLATHYRAGLNYADLDLEAAKKRLDRIYRLKKRLGDSIKQDFIESSVNGEKGAPYENAKKLSNADKFGFYGKFISALCDDLNISEALAALDEFINAANDALDKKQKDKISQIALNLNACERILGVGGVNAFEYFKSGVSAEKRALIESKITERAAAKKEKNFALADKIRDELKAWGVEIMDLPSGSEWEFSR